MKDDDLLQAVFQDNEPAAKRNDRSISPEEELAAAQSAKKLLHMQLANILFPSKRHAGPEPGPNPSPGDELMSLNTGVPQQNNVHIANQTGLPDPTVVNVFNSLPGAINTQGQTNAALMNSQSQGSVIPGQAQAMVAGASPAVQNVVPNNQYANAVANAPSVENPQVPAVSTAAFAPNMFPDRAVDPQQATALLNPDAHLAENDAVIGTNKYWI